MRNCILDVRTLALSAALALGLAGCRIEPPLELAEDGGIVITGEFGGVDLDLNVVWGIDADWRESWWYGWDDTDVDQWGELAYTDPSNYELRFFYLGDRNTTDGSYQGLSAFRVYETRFRSHFEFGYHDLLAWSNVDSKDGTQAVTVEEANPRDVKATTSVSRVLGRDTEQPVYHAPEIFYGGGIDGFYISGDPEDYDYYDSASQTWVKTIEAFLHPLVYIYAVQVVLYNNNGKVTGMASDPVIGNLSHGVTVNTGHTWDEPVSVIYPMRLKSGLPARDGKEADIIGGKLQTFGLCDMPQWKPGTVSAYAGSRGELANELALDFKFRNDADSIIAYDVTQQMQRQSHGGVITIEIDMDTVKMPPSKNPSGSGSGFDPSVEPSDTVEHEFPLGAPSRRYFRQYR